MYTVDRHNQIRDLDLFLSEAAETPRYPAMEEEARCVGYIEQDSKTGEITFHESFGNLERKLPLDESPK